ncbi:MAG: HpcH/HpaI aldolase/citrate lyase family protein, partial [Hyphomicrobiales bacterium]
MLDNPIRDLAGTDRHAYLCWLSIPSGFVAEALAADAWAGALIDCQHGLIGYQDMVAMITAIAGQGKPALVRVPVGATGEIGRALDAGAAGLVCPMIESAADAAAFVREAKYPPIGRRSWGPARPRTLLPGNAYVPETANKYVLAAAMIETATALEAVDEIASVPGLDALFVGPNDLSLSLTDGQIDLGAEKLQSALRRVVASARHHRLIAGIYAGNEELAVGYREMGFQMIPVGSDMAFMKAASARTLKALS